MTTRVACRHRHGHTLIEMLITVALLGIVASMTTLGVRRFSRPSPSDPRAIIADTLERVLATGRSVTLQFIVNGRPVFATVNPDGSVIADTAIDVNRFTGRSTNAK